MCVAMILRICSITRGGTEGDATSKNLEDTVDTDAS